MKRLFTLLFSLLLVAFRLAAQQVDTLYIYEPTVEYDTIFVHDTLWVHDTLHLRHTDVPTTEDLVEADTPASKDARKHDLFRQREKREKREKHPVFQDEFFDGFHFGYLAEVEWAQPTVFTDHQGDKYTINLGKCGWQAGLEFSYNFGKYFGVSAALNYGYLGSPVYNECTTEKLQKTSYGLSLPMKFEFHCPIAPNVWFALDAGARLRAPFKTFTEGFKGFSPYHNAFYEFEEFAGVNTEDMTLANIYEYSKDAPIFNVDLLLDAGFYFKLPNSDLMRASVGLNYALHKYAMGSYHNINGMDFHDGQTFPPELQFTPSEEGIFYSKNNHLALQLAYIHTFHNQKIKTQAQPHWNDGKLLSRHEFRLEISDPSIFSTQFGLPLTRQNFEMPDGYDYSTNLSTPIFAFSYHYRAAKWFWVGMSINYNHFSTKIRSWAGSDSHYNTFCLMPDVRFSYFNRPHCTLYSAAALGLSFMPYENRIQLTTSGGEHFEDLTLLPTFHLTAFGIKTGAKHWFGCAELGYGFKGFASVGVGYEF